VCPAWNAQGRYLVWSDIPDNHELRWLEDYGQVSVFCSPSNYSNGNTGRSAGFRHPFTRGYRQCLLWRTQTQPAVHGGQPVALRTLCRNARSEPGIAWVLPRQFGFCQRQGIFALASSFWPAGRKVPLAGGAAPVLKAALQMCAGFKSNCGSSLTTMFSKRLKVKRKRLVLI
jgi:hypothetical protein